MAKKVKETKTEEAVKLDPTIEKELEKHDSKKYETYEDQIQAEFEIAWEHQKPKKDEALIRLKLYNNQKRDKDKVGDTTMFSTFNTVLAFLYNDRLTVEWSPRNDGDQEVAENLNLMYKADYDAMQKDEIDYDWDWDTCFFGRGILSLLEFERDPDNGIYLPIPEVYDPMTFLRDPRATSINGNAQGKGAARFFGREVKMTKQDLKNNVHIFDTDFGDYKFGANIKSLLEEATEARATAQGNQYNRFKKEAILGANAEYDVLEWFTHLEINGNVRKVRAWLANKGKRRALIGLQVFKNQKFWGLVDRALYPTSHDWDGTSIPDLTEDKQRARAVAINLGLDNMRADMYPMYIYDSNKITNKNDLNFKFNKFIPADGDINNALSPVMKASPNLALVDFIYRSLDLSAQKASASPEMQQGVLTSQDKTLGELNMVALGANDRKSLSSKIFGWSERRFARLWYYSYKENFDQDIDEKVLRLEGAFGAKWRPLTKDQFVSLVDPDVAVKSTSETRAKMLEQRQALNDYFALLLQEPTANRRYAFKMMGKLRGLEQDQIDRLLPPTIDERVAEAQNEELSKNKTVPVLPEDDHLVHLEIHMKAADTPATYAHIKTHEKALMIKKTNPKFFPADQPQPMFQLPGQGAMDTNNPASVGAGNVNVNSTQKGNVPTK